ncbi:MAG: hypothetical protein SOU51_05435 [Collinsella sp.]|nr:hypothetical protein [Collinsella sp.]
MEASSAVRLGIVDLGTVSSRLALVEMRDGAQLSARKDGVITDLGEGVDATGRFSPAAVDRVISAVRMFRDAIDDFAPNAVCMTLTSAARDVDNGGELLLALEDLGFAPQVISGDTEAALTFLGVARDFASERIVVADSGGGSTELVLGSYAPGAPLGIERSHSFDIGCRRITERFLGQAPPCRGDIERARLFVHERFESYWDGVDRPERMVAVGGTVTTIAAMTRRMAVYDPDLIHLSTLSLEDVDRAIDTFSRLDVLRIGRIAGVQPKRAPVILAGSIIVRELMLTGGFDELTISENGLMAGVASTMFEVLSERDPSVGWTPRLSW